MILNKGQVSETNCPLPSQSFTIKNSPLAFEILSSRLYSNPSMAIVRELLTNAYDAQVLVGKENVPIKVSLPDYLNPYFTIRDYGIGLEKDEVMLLYTSFFASTKTSTNDVTGCFGLGSKTPFSYTSGFTVNSYRNGYKYNFLMVKKDSLPHVIYSGSEITDEPNGLEIIIPVDEKDYSLFKSNFYKYLDYIPEIKTTQDSTIVRAKPSFAFYPFEGIDDFVQLIFYQVKDSDYTSFVSWFDDILLKQGQNVYDISSLLNDEIVKNEKAKFKFLASISHVYRLVLEVPIGTFEITPNRETIDSTAKTCDKLIKILTSIEERLIRYDIPKHTSVFKSPTSLRTLIINLKCEWMRIKARDINRNYEYILNNVRINNKDQYSINWSKHAGDIYEYRNGRIIREEASLVPGLNLIIDVPLKQKSTKQVKLIYRLVNHANKFKYYNKILLNYIPTYTESTSRSCLREIEKYLTFKKVLKKFNNTFGKAIYIVHTNLNKIIRECPNDSMPIQFKKKIDPYTDKHRILVRVAVVNDYYIRNASEYNYFKHLNFPGERITTDVEDVLRFYPRNNTIILYNESLISDENWTSTPDWYAIITALGDLPNKATLNGSFTEFLSRYRTIDKGFSIAKHFICISKKNLKYFDDYIKIDVHDLIKYYQDIEICIKKYIGSTMLIDIAMYLDKYLDYYTEEQKNRILNGNAYKRLELIGKLHKRLIKYCYSDTKYEDAYYVYLAKKVLNNDKIKICYFNFDQNIGSLNRLKNIFADYAARRYNSRNPSHYRDLTRMGKIELLKEFLRG